MSNRFQANDCKNEFLKIYHKGQVARFCGDVDGWKKARQDAQLLYNSIKARGLDFSTQEMGITRELYTLGVKLHKDDTLRYRRFTPYSQEVDFSMCRPTLIKYMVNNFLDYLPDEAREARLKIPTKKQMVMNIHRWLVKNNHFWLANKILTKTLSGYEFFISDGNDLAWGSGIVDKLMNILGYSNNKYGFMLHSPCRKYND